MTTIITILAFMGSTIDCGSLWLLRMRTVHIIPFLNTQLTISISCYQKTADTSTNYGYDVITFQSVFEMADHLNIDIV